MAKNTFSSLPDIPKCFLYEPSYAATERPLTDYQLAYFLNVIYMIFYTKNKVQSHFLLSCIFCLLVPLFLSSVFGR